MSQLTTVCFDGDNLQAVRDGERVWVVVKRVCEALRVNYAAQHRRLAEKPWATVAVMATVAEDGKTRELFCLDLDSLPMWLATIEPRRVKEGVREKLIAYQKECAKVLRDHFFGRRQPESFDAGAFKAVVREIVEQVVGPVVDRVVASVIAPMLDRLDALEARGLASCITSQQLRQLRSAVRRVAVLEVACGRWKKRSQANGDLYRALREGCNWGGKGQPFDDMPAAQFPAAIAILNCRRLDAERMLEALAQRRQTQLWNDDGDSADDGDDGKTKH